VHINIECNVILSCSNNFEQSVGCYVADVHRNGASVKNGMSVSGSHRSLPYIMPCTIW